MVVYTSGELAHLIYLCSLYGIRSDGKSPHMTWPKIVGAMNDEAPRHLTGGDLFATDPWQPKQYTVVATGAVCRRWIKDRASRGLYPDSREHGMGMERMGFALDDEQARPPMAFVPVNGNPQHRNLHLRGPRLPSLRQVLNSPNNYPLSILNRSTRLVRRRVQNADGRHPLPDAPER